MKQRCQTARERNIAPLRRTAIEECVSRRTSSLTREDCECIYQDFGQSGGTISEGFRSSIFIDLPECVEYFDAQDKRNNSRSRR